MKNFLTALASALLVAVIVTSLHYYVFSDSADRAPLALFVLSFIGMASVALFNVRQSALRSGLAPAAPVAAGESAARDNKGNARGGSQNNSRGGSKDNSRGGSKDSSRGGSQDTSRGGQNNDRAGNKNARGQRDRKDNRGAAGDPGQRKDAAAAAKPAAPIPDGPRETGTVKWFNRSKGFGFIVRENGEEIFVHHRSIRNADDTRRSNLRDGQSVNYVVADHSKGQQAEDVVGE